MFYNVICESATPTGRGGEGERGRDVGGRGGEGEREGWGEM